MKAHRCAAPRSRATKAVCTGVAPKVARTPVLGFMTMCAFVCPRVDTYGHRYGHGIPHRRGHARGRSHCNDAGCGASAIITNVFKGALILRMSRLLVALRAALLLCERVPNPLAFGFKVGVGNLSQTKPFQCAREWFA